MVTCSSCPNGPGTIPLTGWLPSRAASASIRCHELPGFAAHAVLRAHAASKSAGMVSIVLWYQGSSPRTWYVESRITDCTSDGYRDAKTCANHEPYESPCTPTDGTSRWRMTAARSAADGADVNSDDAWM